MSNTFVKYPKRGDIVVKTLADKVVKYIDLDTFVLADLDTTTYAIVGVVYYRKGKNVGVVYKENSVSGLQYMNRAWWYLTGYTLDGTDQTGILSIRTSTSSSWGTSVDKTISYNATTAEDFVSQLNTAFLADTDFATQDWYANIEADGTIRVHCNFTDYRQYYDAGKSGFTLSTLAKEIPSLADMTRKHGGRGGEGAISNLARAITRFTPDQSAGTYNPKTALTNIKTSYPVCLPAYLGTSANVDGDMCAILRDTYGEGVEGWYKYLNAQQPVVPIGYGNMAQHNGKSKTAELVSHTFVSTKTTTETPCCKAASYCYNKSSDVVEVGEFWLPTTEEIYYLLDGVTYGTNSSRDSDILNKALNAISGSAISNGSYYWSCCRYNSVSAWNANGYSGFFYCYGYMYGYYVAVPVSLYKVA